MEKERYIKCTCKNCNGTEWEIKKMSYYVRATGNNRFMGGGTSNWLKIRGIDKNRGGYEIKVRVAGRTMYIASNNDPELLEFGAGWPGLMPVSFERILKKNIKGD